jgi:6-phosphogluconolactonase
MPLLVYVGSFNRSSPFFPDADGAGITVYRWDGRGQRLDPVQTVGDIANPSWLAIDEDRRLLYATSEIADAAEGRISAFRIAADGRLTFASACSSGGSSPCHMALSPDGETLIEVGPLFETAWRLG